LATDWQAGLPVRSSDRLAPEISATGGPETAHMVQRIATLVVGEAALVKQQSPGSMSVVLRPDTETELFLHLTQRNGQIEACVRCEHGHFERLNALWPQLQESLAHQKVRLAPLQESSLNGMPATDGPGAESNFSRSDPHSRQPRRAEEESLAERPSSASPLKSSGSLHPERRRSGNRLTTSRPGWETWA
jgi:hypothetical protein